MTTLELAHRPDMVLHARRKNNIVKVTDDHPGVASSKLEVNKVRNKAFSQDIEPSQDVVDSKRSLVASSVSLGMLVTLAVLSFMPGLYPVGIIASVLSLVSVIVMFDAVANRHNANIETIANRFSELGKRELGITAPAMLNYQTTLPRNGVVRMDGSQLGEHEGMVVDFIIKSNRVVAEYVVTYSNPENPWDANFDRLEDDYSPSRIRAKEAAAQKALRKEMKGQDEGMSLGDIAKAAGLGVAFGLVVSRLIR